MRDDYEGPRGGGGATFGLPKPSFVVKWLLIANIGVFVIQLLAQLGLRVRLERWFGVTLDGAWQVWRYLTFQFLHSSGSLLHLALNMLGLYFLGTPLEQHWGRRRFLAFYLSCGVAAGLAYVLAAGAVPLPGWIPLVGASGGVYGIVLACAVLFPHFRIIFLFFPVPIRLAAIIIFGAMGLTILMSLGQPGGVWDPAFWSDIAHLGGAVTGAAWIWVVPRFAGAGGQARQVLRKGAWERKMRRREQEQAEIDRILSKIHDHGIASLTRHEKRKLKEASERQREEERRFG